MDATIRRYEEDTRVALTTPLRNTWKCKDSGLLPASAILEVGELPFFPSFRKMRHSLYKYYSARKWADAFLDGTLRFHSLAYFRDFEDVQVRGDKNEGKMIFRPEDGLVITNHTQGWTRTIPRALNATVKQEEIFIFCLSISFTRELRESFKAVACVEILDVKTFCNRIESALPSETVFPGKPGKERIGQPVRYYEETDDCNPTWACPDMIAALKSDTFAWQDEYRLVFSLTNALAFENAQYALVREGTSEEHKQAEHQPYDLNAGSLRDICRLHVFETETATTVSPVST